ncbi:hypothetical protein SNEBB_000503 [Seison nebaliae]|nr:hypothetical protein SNEBB_000503 [Seison nebaliae]
MKQTIENAGANSALKAIDPGTLEAEAPTIQSPADAEAQIDTTNGLIAPAVPPTSTGAAAGDATTATGDATTATGGPTTAAGGPTTTEPQETSSPEETTQPEPTAAAPSD